MGIARKLICNRGLWRTTYETAWKVVPVACVLGLVFILLSIVGCASGRTQSGGVVVGLEVGEPLPESTAQAIIGTGQTIGGMFGMPALGGALATAVVGIWGTKKSGDAKLARAEKVAADAAWDEATARERGTGGGTP